jgi:hypothetical protein
MASYGCIPLARLDIFPLGALLQIELALGIEHMQVDNGMQQFRSVMALATRSRAYHPALLIYDGEYFLAIILLHGGQRYKKYCEGRNFLVKCYV